MRMCPDAIEIGVCRGRYDVMGVREPAVVELDREQYLPFGNSRVHRQRSADRDGAGGLVEVLIRVRLSAAERIQH